MGLVGSPGLRPVLIDQYVFSVYSSLSAALFVNNV